MGEVSAGIPAKPSERQSTDPVPTRAQPAESPDDYLDSETGPLCGLRRLISPTTAVRRCPPMARPHPH